MKTQAVQKTTQQLSRFLTKNSPTILTGVSVAGLVTTTVMAVKATPKALQLLEMERDYRERMGGNYGVAPITKIEAIKLTWQCWIPPVAMGGITIACILSANSINLKRNAALAGVYSIAEASLKEYKAKVIETVGATKEKKIKDEIAKDRITKNPVKDNEVIFTGKGETLCYESLSGRYFRSDIEKIRKAENELNREMLSDMFLSLNDIYYAIGLSNTKMGDEIGWRNDDGLFGFEFSSQLTPEGEPCLVLDYVMDPRYDYMDSH